MKNIKAFIVIGIACLMHACSSPKQDEQGLKTIHVEVDNIRSDVKLSEFAEAKIIPLPTSDNLEMRYTVSLVLANFLGRLRKKDKVLKNMHVSTIS